MRLVKFIKKCWKDPVWSKVIAAGIVSIFTFTLSGLYALFAKLFAQVSFSITFDRFYIFLTQNVYLEVWLFFLFIFIYIILIFKPACQFFRHFYSKLKNTKTPTKEKNNKILPVSDDSSVLFSYRMAQAFPGIRDVTWFENPNEARRRLEILFKEPIIYDLGKGGLSRPIWWFRGGEALFIEFFKKKGPRSIVMNFEQLKIKRIAAYHGSLYYKDFVYIETDGEKPSGIYDWTPERLKQYHNTIGYVREEYALIKKCKFWKRKISRADYDDGATVIRGKVKNTPEAKLRVRYLTPYNFIVAANGSPYNSRKFDDGSKEFLDGILSGTVDPNDFFDFLKSFHKHEV